MLPEALATDHVDGDTVIDGTVPRELEQLTAVVQAMVELRQPIDNLLELLLFAPEILRALRIVPDVRILELPRDGF